MTKKAVKVDISDLIRKDSGAQITKVVVLGNDLRFELFNPNLEATTRYLAAEGVLELYIGTKPGYDPRMVTVPSSVGIPDGTKRIIYAGAPATKKK